MERRKVDILCVQETRWKGSKARSIGAGFKLFYYGVDSKRNGVGVVLKEEFVRNVLEVKRVSDRVMSLKLEIEGVTLNVVSGYAPQVGCELEEKERFWSELDEVMESIPTGERVVIGADFNGHVGEGNTGDEEVMGKFGVKERNLEGQMVVDFAKRMDMAVVNTYFRKREEHRVTYKSGGRRTQVDYILCRRGNLKEISDCKVVVGESVARQYRMVVCRMTLMVCKKKKRSEIEKKTKWWKLKKEECCEEFRQKMRQALGCQVVLPDDWETTAEVIRVTGRKVLGVSSGRRKEDKENWWWNEDVQDSIQRKRLAKKKWDMDRTEENRQEYKELQHRVKREVTKAKQKAYKRVVHKDLEKAYDRVPREELWYCMRKSGVAEKYVRVVQGHAILVVHWFLTVCGCIAWLTSSYIAANFSVLAVGVWAMAQRDSVDAVLMFLIGLLLTIVIDIIHFAVFYSLYKATDLFRFSVGMAILSLLLKPLSSFFVYQMYRERGGEYNINFGFPTVTQNRDSYQSIDQQDQPDNSAKPFIQGEDQKHAARPY
ncbi:hypothetical protein QTP70_018763 [Hemibagrus guttatus]|uniref:Endonuclease/exonuclease/phosphatase domain-containing protein n=1 Tax=Hemibagrus guttatus TaxID=175788 RepID=A0AAE0Q302_9TELE|nr:hypothetical protein QTP70_018763 [Hemibagrus guttatus]